MVSKKIGLTSFLLLIVVNFLIKSICYASTQPINVRLGMFIIDVYDIDFPKNEVSVDFYIWFTYESKFFEKINPLETFDIINAKSVEIKRQFTRNEGGLVYQRAFVKAVIKKNWTVIDFPFDEHTIRIIIEDNLSLGDVVYEPDIEGSGILKNLRIPGWEVNPLKIEKTLKKWESSLGDPSVKGQGLAVPRVMASFMIERPGGGAGLFFKVFSAVLVSVAISFFSLLVKPDEFEVRVSLSIGSLFAAVGSQFVVGSFLPESSVPTMVDYMHVIAYIFIALASLICVVTHNIYEYNETKALVINKISLVLLPLMFVLSLVFMWFYYFGAGFQTTPTV